MIDIRKNRRQMVPVSRVSLAALLCLYTIAAIISFLSLNNMPLDYFRLPVEPVQSLYLLAAYLLLALPFFFSGLIIATGYTTVPEKAGRLAAHLVRPVPTGSGNLRASVARTDCQSGLWRVFADAQRAGPAGLEPRKTNRSNKV